MASVVVVPSSDPEVITIPSQGPQGPPGVDGVPGPPGSQGPPGPPGPGVGAIITISDTPPAGAVDRSLWWESDTGGLYVRYNDGNSSQWVIIAFPQPDPAGFVQYSAQTPTSTQQQAARTNIGAAAGQVTVFAVGGAGSGTYNTPAGCKLLHIKMVGAGGGGGGGGPSSAGVGGNGGSTTFYNASTGLNAFAGGGNGGGPIGNAGGSPGSASGGQINIPGANGSPSSGVGGTSSDLRGAQGATSLYLGGAGEGGWPGAAGGNGGCGAGGGGGSSSQVGACGAGGGGGGYCELWINNPVATYTWAVGAGGIGGTLGGGVSNCSAGGNGGPGLLVAEEFY